MTFCVGFDLDMTLVDSRPGIADVMTRLAAESGADIDVDAVVARLGPPLEQELANRFPADRIPAMAARYRELYADYGVPGSPYVVLVDGTSGRVRGEGTGQSWRQVAELLARSGGPDPAKPGADARRESDVDRELMAAGLLPGDPRLYEPGPN